MKKIKSYIPNALTISRIILTPIIIVTGILGYTKALIILATIAALTDLLDGKLARKWNVVSEIGAKLDTLADKLFAIGTIGCLIKISKILWIPFILEIVIISTNFYFYLKTKKAQSIMVGKIKTTFLFTTIIIAIATVFLPNIKAILFGMTYATINLQVLSMIGYIDKYFKDKQLSIENNEMHRKIMNEEPDEFEKTMILDDLKELTDEYQYNNNDII